MNAEFFSYPLTVVEFIVPFEPSEFKVVHQSVCKDFGS